MLVSLPPRNSYRPYQAGSWFRCAPRFMGEPHWLPILGLMRGRENDWGFVHGARFLLDREQFVSQRRSLLPGDAENGTCGTAPYFKSDGRLVDSDMAPTSDTLPGKRNCMGRQSRDPAVC